MPHKHLPLPPLFCVGVGCFAEEVCVYGGGGGGGGGVLMKTGFMACGKEGLHP